MKILCEKKFDRDESVWFTVGVEDETENGDTAMKKIEIKLKNCGNGTWVKKDVCGIERWSIRKLPKMSRVYEATGNETGRSFLRKTIQEIKEHLTHLTINGW